ncbi:hypothetical protein P1J78_15755 [Psychromarinibacter sp. C21-152]|uniref:Hemolysin-type calcium-binding repeat-containing protein n=1 Tax=Psychromarinibacter sediminicola TaxID=3033385 RepID=A0AAE3T961_9RHOB|nr:hypothetical protein [Psychromarinibacter sediminicola]MDF0602195.1 hypothetical protein [Psychromarinibacter sediminicola]
MFELLLLLLMAVGAGFLVTDTGSSNDEEEETPDPEPDPESGLSLILESDTDFVGTEDDDEFFGRRQMARVSIDARGGNDYIQLGEDSSAIDVAGGAGDDTILASEGITAHHEDGGSIDGGDGNDKLVVDGGPGAVLPVLGGAGDDFINVRGGINMAVDGGEGDDRISFDLNTLFGDGYSLSIQGGEGDDTLRGDISAASDRDADILGGEGADVFDLTVDNVLPELREDFFYEKIDEDTYRAQVAQLDFEAGEDKLILSHESMFQDIVLEQIEVRETPADPEAGTAAKTDMILHYRDDNDEGARLEIVLGLGETTGVTEDDIVLRAQPENGLVFT